MKKISVFMVVMLCFQSFFYNVSYALEGEDGVVPQIAEEIEEEKSEETDEKEENDIMLELHEETSNVTGDKTSDTTSDDELGHHEKDGEDDENDDNTEKDKEDSEDDKEDGQDGDKNLEDAKKDEEDDSDEAENTPTTNENTFLRGTGNDSEKGTGNDETTVNSGSEENNVFPSLKITEVYIWSSDERIEITNVGDEDFEGDFVLEGVKKKNGKRTGENIVINAHSSLIFTNGTINFKDGILVSSQDPSFVISDEKKDPIYLLFSGNIIDSFSINANGTNDSNKKNKFSFQRNLETDEIIAGISNKIKTESENETGENGTGTVETGTNLSGIDNETAKLVVSEVWYDDCEEEDYCDIIVKNKEWIEISNLGTGGFLGDFTLSGNVFGVTHAVTFENMYLPAGGFLILANDPTFLSLDEGILGLGLDYPQLQIADDQEILIEIWRDEKKEDRFFIDKERVVKKDDWMVSFHKVMKTPNGIVTQAITNDSQNIQAPLQANPGVVYPDADTEIIDCSKPKEPTPPNPPIQDPEEPSDGECGGDLMEISEIFAGGERYDPYVEILLHEDLPKKYKNLILSGGILNNSITINLQESTENYEFSYLQKNSRILITQKPGELAEAGLLTLLLHDDFEIQSFNGDLELRGYDGQSRQLFDKILIYTGNYEKSIYKTEKVKVCGVVFDKVDDFSPGFSEDVLTYFSPTSKFNIKTVETVKYVGGGGGGCSCPSKEQLCGKKENPEGTGVSLENEDSPSLSGNKDVLPKSSDFSSLLGKIKILDLQYLSPETITLQSFLSEDIDLTQKSYYLKSSTSTTKKYLTGTLKSFSVDTFSKNFGFPDAGACISLYAGENQLDEYCYEKETKEKQEKKSDDSSVNEKETKIIFNPHDYSLKILDILYDPEGTDTNNEVITIQNTSSQSLDMTKIKMKVNTTNKKLSGVLEAGETKEFKGTFGFPNSTKDNTDVVVSLFYEDTIFDTYSYNPNKKVENQTGTVKVYSVLDGDTFRFRKEDGTLQSVRLLGADAPESNKTRYRTTECFGVEAKNYLTNLIKNKNVRLEFDDSQEQIDLYGRYLAYVYLDDEFINQKMIAEGYAKEYTFKTEYQFQKEFQKSEQEAKDRQKGLRSSHTCGKSLEEVPEIREQPYENLSLSFQEILYDPEGIDKNNEKITLSVDSSQFSGTEIDFSDNFSLQIFPRGEYATGTTKTKSLETVGILPLSSFMILTGDFSLPNSKATCVSLKYKEYTFDTLCYNPLSGNLESETQESQGIPNIRFLSIVPNPSGKDTEKEEITLFREKNEDEPEELDLSQNFSLLINGKTKKKITGILIPFQEITLKGNFSLPNSASCISLQKGETILDTFCYEKPKEGTLFKENNERIEEIQQEDLSILKKISLVKKNDQLCVVYNKTTFTCKKIPNSTTEIDKKLLSFQNTFISELQTSLKNDYSLLFYQSDLKDYFSLYTSVKKQIKDGNQNYQRNGTPIKITDVSQIFKRQYNQSVQEYMMGKFVSEIPDAFQQYFSTKKEMYFQSLWER